jgi:uncharacterized membrane protein YecN with MAPEG domain
MDFPEARKFLLASYHDLPNVLFVGSLVIGLVSGYLPLVWASAGLAMNWVVTIMFQMLAMLVGQYYPGFVTKTLPRSCSVAGIESKDRLVVPSLWMSSSAFFAMFTIYNSIRVTMRKSKAAVDEKLVSARRAFSISTFFVGIIFLLLIFARMFTECDTWLGGGLGVLVGAGVAIGFWHLVDCSGSGKIPDLLQVVGSMAPDKVATETPLMCVPPKS